MIRGSRLRRHGRATYDSPAYRKDRATLLAHATVCHWCGLPPTHGDPLTADHTEQMNNPYLPPLVAAHRSCNSRRGGYARAGNTVVSPRIDQFLSPLVA
jgi:hypothetical protein